MKLTPSLQWWRVAQERGLIRDAASDDFNPSRIATQYCGVSLSYLETLASSIQLVNGERGVQNESTKNSMQQVVMPALVKSGNGTR